MFNGDCLSLNNDNGSAFLSRYFMLCHASDTTLPLFDTSVTVANIDPMQKWLPLNYSFVHIQNSPTNLVFATKILKNLLS